MFLNIMILQKMVPDFSKQFKSALDNTKTIDLHAFGVAIEIDLIKPLKEEMGLESVKYIAIKTTRTSGTLYMERIKHHSTF